MQPEEILSTAALILLAVCCVTSNGIVCYALYQRKIELCLATRYLLFSLAATDLMVGTVTIPLYVFMVAGRSCLDHNQKILFWGIFGMIDVMCLTASILHLCMISIDRAVAIRRPLIHRTVATRTNILKLLSVLWITSIIVGLPYIFVLEHFLWYLVYLYVLAVLFYIVPVLIITVSYISIICTIKYRNKSSIGNCNYRINEKKSTKTIFIVILAFVICWSPFIVTSRYNVTKGYINGSWPQNEWYYTLIKLLTYLNSTLNPFIYAVSHPQFRTAFKEMFRCLGMETSRKGKIRNKCQPQRRDDNEENVQFNLTVN